MQELDHGYRKADGSPVINLRATDHGAIQMTALMNDENITLAQEAETLGIRVETLQAVRDPGAIFDNLMNLGLTLPRWLYWERQAKDGEALTEEQQKLHEEDFEQMKKETTRLVIGTMPDVNNGSIHAVDILSPIAQAWGYFVTATQLVKPTREKPEAIWRREVTWAQTTDAFKAIREILCLGTNQEQQELGEKYLGDREDGHSILATVTRTMMTDWVYGWTNMESDGFKRDLEIAKGVFASMHRVNSHWEPCFYGSLVSQMYMFWKVGQVKDVSADEVNAAAYDILQTLKNPPIG